MITFRKSTTASMVVALLACGQSGAEGGSIIKVPLGDSPQRGPADAWVTLVEFGDFQCPFCRSEQAVLADVEAVYGADLRVVFKHLPLASIHPRAQAAAVAAECAGEQGKFWEMHDLLFTTALDDLAILEDAGRVPALDVSAWQACVAAPAASSRVAEDLALGIRLGIEGTPTFVVNGVPVVGAVPEDDLRTVIDRARAAAVASGIPRADYYAKAVLGE